jgi:5'-nucleotidase
VAPPCSKVVQESMRLDGHPIDPARRYRVTVNSFLAGGGDDFSVFARATDSIGGVLDLDALAAWLSTHDIVSPDMGPRIHRAP